ncbi:hypothetical protein H0X09_00060 [Candidatus Saccharibacteria bacterium]|nr:hypothetical protein [Candidatus Saccharibacteria bacterium]
MKRLYYLAGLLDNSNLPGTKADGKTIDKIFALVYVILGALAVLLFVVAGLRYITAQGDPAKIAQSKMRLLHIAVGLVIAALAVAIVNFVITRVGN